MKKKLKHYLKEILSFIVIIVILANALSYYRATNLNKEKLPIENISLNEKPILIHFWATWCPTCKVEAANIEAISKDYNVLTIAVNSGDNLEIQNYLHKHNLTFKVLNDEQSIYAKKFNVTVFPTTFIYDKDKNLIFTDVGYTSTIGLYLRMWWANL